MTTMPADWWYALYDKQNAGRTVELEDWYSEVRLVLAPADPMSGFADLVELPLADNGVGIGDDDSGDEDAPPVMRLTRESAVWLRDALTAALADS